MKETTIIYHGSLWEGSTSLQRARAFREGASLNVVQSDNGHRVGKRGSFLDRLFWKLRIPIDSRQENASLLSLSLKHFPDVIFVDNSKVIRRRTLHRIRSSSGARLVYYSPDDIMLKWNLSIPLLRTLPDWDIVFTTKTFNVSELAKCGVRRPILVGKAFDPHLDVPMTRSEVGDEFELFDAVFIGTYEEERCRSINALAAAGVRVLVHGSDKGGWRREHLHGSVELRPSVFAKEYRSCWHHGKVALCFLRKMSRDKITQRTMEIAAMGRPMLAEKTEEHDDHFRDGVEYVGFRDDGELVARAQELLRDRARRERMGSQARSRCLSSGYSSHERAAWMVEQMVGTR